MQTLLVRCLLAFPFFLIAYVHWINSIRETHAYSTTFEERERYLAFKGVHRLRRQARGTYTRKQAAVEAAASPAAATATAAAAAGAGGRAL